MCSLAQRVTNVMFSISWKYRPKVFAALTYVHLQYRSKVCPMKFAQYCSPGRALSVMMGIKQPGDLFAMEMTNDRRCAVSYF